MRLQVVRGEEPVRTGLFPEVSRFGSADASPPDSADGGGVTDHVWTCEEIAAYWRDLSEPATDGRRSYAAAVAQLNVSA